MAKTFEWLKLDGANYALKGNGDRVETPKAILLKINVEGIDDPDEYPDVWFPKNEKYFQDRENGFWVADWIIEDKEKELGVSFETLRAWEVA